MLLELLSDDQLLKELRLLYPSLLLDSLDADECELDSLEILLSLESLLEELDSLDADEALEKLLELELEFIGAAVAAATTPSHALLPVPLTLRTR